MDSRLEETKTILWTLVQQGNIRSEIYNRVYGLLKAVDGDVIEGALSSVMSSAKSRIEVLEMAVAWALGENGEFPERQDGEGAYWWRTELRRRAGKEGA